jgi:hypothetical protein
LRSRTAVEKEDVSGDKKMGMVGRERELLFELISLLTYTQRLAVEQTKYFGG